MKPELLYVVTPRFNPVRYQAPERNFARFEQHMIESGVNLHVVELQVGDRPFVATPSALAWPAGRYQLTQLRSRHELWFKENLINIGVSRLPADWKYVAWIDGDVHFRRPEWAAETVHKLQTFDVVQPWSHLEMQGPNGPHEHVDMQKGFVARYHEMLRDDLAGTKPHGTPHGKHAYGGWWGHCLPGDAEILPGGKISAASQRWYAGEVVVIRTASGNELTCTPNHPVFANGRWVPAASINVGDDVLRHLGEVGRADDADEKHIPSRIEDVARAFSEKRGIERTARPSRSDDFHGDGRGSEVTIIWADRLLAHEIEAVRQEVRRQSILSIDDLPPRAFDGDGPQALLLERLHLSPSARAKSCDCPPLLRRRLGEHPGADLPPRRSALLIRHRGPLAPPSFASWPDHAGGFDLIKRGPFAEADDFGGLPASLAGKVEPDEVVYIGRRDFAGHVYNLNTEHGYIIANGVVTHNCGMAWACRRSAWDKLGGLIDTAILGSADHHMACALVGAVRASAPDVTPAFIADLKRWEARAEKHIRRNVGFVRGTIDHHFHGSGRNRKYVERWKILKRNAFDPATDLKRDWQGLWQLTGNKPRLRDDLRLYFSMRNEDSTDL